MTQSLFSQIQNSIPRTPGVYFFRDKKHTILYVGKAANLRSRLSSYFLKSALLEAAKRRMLHEAEHITWQETETEIEALLLEASLIKKHIPPYNIVMRDDKQYLFVGFTKEQFPRIFFTHQPLSLGTRNMKHETQFIGPFTESRIIKNLLRSLRKTFPYCTCKTNHNRACQRGELGLCPGTCCIKSYEVQPRKILEYKKNIRFLK